MLMSQENGSFPRSRQSIFPDRIIMTGFRATGKSAVGAILAERLGLNFIDTDIELCVEFTYSVAEYVERKGWAAFRQREKALLAKLAGVTHTVISTGGGSILHEAEWNRLRENSLVVLLQADAEIIRRRLNKDELTAGQRPPLAGSGSGNEVENVLAVRTPLYLKGADMRVDTAALTPEEIVNMIEQEISSKFSMEE